MVRRFADCRVCACLIHAEDASCPFCGALQRHVGAPVWVTVALIGGLGLADVGCDGAGDGSLEFREFEASTGGVTTSGGSTSGSSGSSGTGTTTEDTGATSDGSTYAGPDEQSMTLESTDTGLGSSSSGSDVPTFASSVSDGVTYAGPDENSSIDPPGSPSDSETDSETEGGEEQDPGDDGCSCSSRARPSGQLLGLVLLGVLRRRSRRGRAVIRTGG